MRVRVVLASLGLVAPALATFGDVEGKALTLEGAWDEDARLLDGEEKALGRAAQLKRDMEAAVVREDYDTAANLQDKLDAVLLAPAAVAPISTMLDDGGVQTELACEEYRACEPSKESKEDPSIYHQWDIGGSKHAAGMKAVCTPSDPGSPVGDRDEVYVGCAPHTTPADESAACKGLGVELTGGASRGMPTVRLAEAPPTDPANKKRAAVCVVGQLRSLGVVYMNWEDGPFFQVMRHGEVDLDLFVVTSASSSFELWADFLKSMKPVSTVVATRMSFVSEPGEPWGYFETADADDAAAAKEPKFPQLSVKFNTAKFPQSRLGSQNSGSYLIQVVPNFICSNFVSLIHKMLVRVPDLAGGQVPRHDLEARTKDWHQVPARGENALGYAAFTETRPVQVLRER